MGQPPNDTPKPDPAAREPEPRRRVAGDLGLGESGLGDWVDPTDLADRQAWERSRDESSYERPPHY
jgi:hypothetical protein